MGSMCGGGSRRHDPLPTEDHQEPLVPLSDRRQAAPPRPGAGSTSQALTAQAQQLRALQQIHSQTQPTPTQPPPSQRRPLPPAPTHTRSHHPARQYNASQPESVDALTANWSRLSSSNVNENVLIKLAREQAANRAQMISEGMDAETASELACGYFEEMMETLDISDLIDRDNKLYPKMLEGGKQIIRGGLGGSASGYRPPPPPQMHHYTPAPMASAPSILGGGGHDYIDDTDSDGDGAHHEISLGSTDFAPGGLSPWQLEQLRSIQRGGSGV